VISALVYGGTFDPVHNGHLAIAHQASVAAGAQAVWFVPASLAPLRERPFATPEERFDLLLAATQGEPAFAVLDLAVRRGGVSYTIDTMDALHHLHPDLDLPVMIGADAARTIPAWERADDLLRRERFVVVNRTGVPPPTAAELEGLGFPPERTEVLSVDSPNISASEVRRRLGRGEPVDGLLPDAVAAMIESRGMYRSNRDDA
jgi:nicotinate-nucleotide adenylyltransferase